MLSWAPMAGTRTSLPSQGRGGGSLAAMNVRNVRFESCSGNPSSTPAAAPKSGDGGGVELGVLGQLHPSPAQNYGMDCDVLSPPSWILPGAAGAAGWRGSVQPLPASPASPGTSPWCAATTSPWPPWWTASAGAPEAC